MLKRDITYLDFNDEEVTDTFYFNITKSEIVELEVEHKEGLDATIKKIIETKDNKSLIAEFKRIILLSYGEKSADGKRFDKTDEMRKGFSQTAAYDALFMELATQDEAAATFIKGVLPNDMSVELDKMAMPPPPNTKTAPDFTDLNKQG